ncbi:DUF2630 family protein [Actinoalloteichus hymeniacidonis]|uniref:DUF2630 family protein n=1 Tax=Actinoalloteichus hymeniacidonis TaxID=340345 RepID=A0AAC9HT96_9PSEU|nr:DUF2630 family protein [Actinoalloteichus hymeniacidonis]AOS65197.1 putative DUF2630 family protein [Actinoalloteichus hymeniacidonis]MBB5906723.1 chromosome condensin MukBEF complex kleisin-like MukF subunit [Actinoalloteichus hymeniacidonis]
MRETEILERIRELVDEEHALRHERESGRVDRQAETERLNQVESALDQCWDLLRRRRVQADAGADPDDVVPRDPAEVQRYQQ